MKAIDKLRVKRKKGETIFHYPVGLATKSDARWLSNIFNDEFIRQATERGYDIETMEFELSPRVGNGKFKSQRVDD